MAKKPHRSFKWWCWLMHSWWYGVYRRGCNDCDRAEERLPNGKWREYRPSELDTPNRSELDNGRRNR